MKKNIVIIYHGNCSGMDGFGGAWAAWKKFGDKADYFPATDREHPPEGLKGKEIYIIDYSYPEEVTKKLMRDNVRVTGIDHHVSAEAVTKMTQDHSYALDRSGATLAWEYFHPKQPIPWLLRYIEDGDLWRHALKGTKEIKTWLRLSDVNFKTWSTIAKELERPALRKKHIEEGKVLLKYQASLIHALLYEYAEEVLFEGHRTLAVNFPFWSSEIGNLFAEHLPPMGIIWSERDGKVRVSLRSIGDLDVSKLAARYGGGGHKNAAGFTFPSGTPFPWQPVSPGKSGFHSKKKKVTRAEDES